MMPAFFDDMYTTTDIGEEALVLPVSFAQQRLWFLHQLEPDNCAYNMPVAVRISGALNSALLEQSLNMLIERHEILRTAFLVVDNQPSQVVVANVPFQLKIEDMPGGVLGDQEDLVQRRMREEASIPFDLRRVLLMRVHLFRLAQEMHMLLLIVHHIIADGWSMHLLLSELGELYTALLVRRAEKPSTGSIQYGDFAVWQRKWLAGARLEQHIAYWSQQLAGATTSLDLPVDRPRSSMQSFRGALYTFLLPQRLTRRLETWSEQEGVTLFMTLLAGFQAFLYRYTGQKDLIVGTPVAGRTRVETEKVVGCFVNLLALRCNLAGNPRFRALVQHVRETCLEAYAHQEVPFEKLVDELQVQRDPARPPLVQVVLAFQNMPTAPLTFAGLTLQPVRIDSHAAKFDFLLDAEPGEQGLAGTVEYNSDLFNEATIASMMRQLQTLLEGIMTDPDGRIDDFSLLTRQESEHIQIECNPGAADYPRETPLQKLFEIQVELHPDTPAVVCGADTLTYRELNMRANQLAHYLLALGIGPDVPVALFLERSVDVLIGIMGILKAGGAYVPLDPAYPVERLRSMLEDSGSPVVLLHYQMRGRLPEHPARRVYLDTEWEQISAYSMANPPCYSSTDHLAYLIYTSGSTGYPKGVMVTQHGVLNLCYGFRGLFEDTRVRNVALITSVSFDISVNQMFPTLLFGKTLHIIQDAIKYNRKAFVQYVMQRHIHLFDAVPSYLNVLVGELEGEHIAHELCYILAGGEKLEQRLVQAIFQQFGTDVSVINMYGLTETTDINALMLITHNERDRAVTVGHPLQNNRIYIVNRRDQLQPIGVVGEVCIAGESLARGYWRRPDLSAEVFVPCPFEKGAMMCRTGDLGRWLSDGTIELQGRIDHQVKVRGFRIEPGEIETLLNRHMAVRESVVIVREDRPGDQRLIAYVVLKAEKSFPASELRRYLQQHVPDYMLPVVVLLADLPRTPNGKIQRKGLPVPEVSASETGYCAPGTKLEEALGHIWQDLLGVERIGIDDSFFEFGGHSLLATRLMMQIHREMDIEVPLRRLFETPTIRYLARYIEMARRLAALALSGPSSMSDEEEGVL